MKKLVINMALAASLISIPAVQAMNASQAPVSTWSSGMKVGAGVVAAVTGYAVIKGLYKLYNHYLENKIINETVDAVYLALTLNSTIAKLPAKQQEQALRKKAWLINLRKRVIAQVQAHMQNENLSQKHRNELGKMLENVTAGFAVVDGIRLENPYEKEYQVASWFDIRIERNLVQSIVLKFKPDSECTPSELQKKKAMEQRRAQIVDRLTDKIINNAVNRFGVLLWAPVVIALMGDIFGSGLQ